MDADRELLEQVSEDLSHGLVEIIDRARRINEDSHRPLEWGGGREADTLGDYVYLIRAGNGLHKIGYSQDPQRRASELLNMSPIYVEIVHLIRHLDARTLEGLLHRIFEDRNHHGEWFNLGAIDVAFIKALNKDNATLVLTGTRGLWEE